MVMLIAMLVKLRGLDKNGYAGLLSKLMQFILVKLIKYKAFLKKTQMYLYSKVQIWIFVWEYMILTSNYSSERENWIPTCHSFLVCFSYTEWSKKVNVVI